MKKETRGLVLLVSLMGLILSTGTVMAATVTFFGQGGVTGAGQANGAFQNWYDEAVNTRGQTRGEQSFNGIAVGTGVDSSGFPTTFNVSYNTNPGNQPVSSGDISGAEVISGGTIFGSNGLKVVDIPFVDFNFNTPINAFGFFGKNVLDSQNLEVYIGFSDLTDATYQVSLNSTGDAFFWGIVTDAANPFDFLSIDSSTFDSLIGMEIDSVEVGAINAVPVPGSFLLLASGLIGFFWKSGKFGKAILATV